MAKKQTGTHEYLFRTAAATAVAAAMLTGCGLRKSPVAEETLIETVLSGTPYEEGAETETVIDFPVPDNIPGILIDRTGYECESSKQVIFTGDGVGDSFSVVNADSGAVVYSGEIRQRSAANAAAPAVWRGDFSEFETPGDYYITTEGLGRSYTFTIRNDHYALQLADSLKALHSMRCGDPSVGACHTGESAVALADSVVDVSGGWHTDGRYDKDTLTGAGMVQNLLMAYECEPAAFTDGMGLPQSGNGIPDLLDEIRYETDWLLKMQDESGAVSSGVSTSEVTDYSDPVADRAQMQIGGVAEEPTLLFACALAHFGAIYRNYDADYADRCLFSAEQAYQYLKEIRDGDEAAIGNEAWFMVNAELFKTTAKDEYHDEILEILKSGVLPLESSGRIGGINPVFFGDYAYLTTGRYADREICGKIMHQIMTTVRDITDASASDPYLIDAPGTGIVRNETILQRMLLLTYVNCFITNREYRTVIQEHMHYLGGRNERSEIYLTDYGVRTKEADAEYYCVADDKELYYTSVRMVILSSIDNRYIQVE